MDEFITVSDKNFKKEKIDAVKNRVGILLLTGMAIGICLFVSFLGILQQFAESILQNELYKIILKIFWFNVPWWVWAGFIIMFVLLFFWIKYINVKKMLKKC